MRIFAISFCFCIAGSVFAQSLDGTFDIALGTAGLNTQTAQFDQYLLPILREEKQASLLYQQLAKNPWRTPAYAGVYRDEMASANDRQYDLLATGSRMLGFGIRRSLLGNPIQYEETISKRTGSLVIAVEKLRQAGIVKVNTPSLASIPEPAQQAAALIINVSLNAAKLRRASLAGLKAPVETFDRLRLLADQDDPERVAKSLDDGEKIDLRFLSSAGQEMVAACNTARTWMLGVSPNEKFSWSIPSSWGDIIISGGSDNKFGDGAAFLVLDTGGDDTYIGLPANRSYSNWISIVLDSSGQDFYLSNENLKDTKVADYAKRADQTGFGPAAANLGLAFLFDVRGKDVYRTTAPGIGWATYGVSVVCDSEGNDTYDAYTQGIGAASYGVAIVEDLAGNDRYDGFNSVQGFGGVQGFGALVDRAGNDIYVANNTKIDFPSPQTATANVSMAQGAGVGRRADFTDGHSLAGGVGILFDLDGDDIYKCGVFGQGVGYWMGLGALWDRSGNDTYEGTWYAQGAAAHFAIGYLEDEDGTDKYTVSQNMAHGAGHDFSAGFLLDKSGNDEYNSPNLSLGAGNANGIGVFMDFDGNDKYSMLGLGLGRAAESPKETFRANCLCLGLFYDGNGTDQYPAAMNWARDNSRLTNWTDRAASPAQSQMGIFWDR